MRMPAKLEYKISALAHFVITFTLIGFAIVSLVQGIKTQFSGDTLLGFLLYLATPMLVFVSYLAYQKAHYMLRVLALARK